MKHGHQLGEIANSSTHNFQTEQHREKTIQAGAPYLSNSLKPSNSVGNLGGGGLGKFTVYKAHSVKKVIIKPKVARIFNSTTPKRSRANTISSTDHHT